MSKRERWWLTNPKTYRGVLLDTAAIFFSMLLIAAVIDDDGWRGGLAFGGGLAALRLVLNSALLWNAREPKPRQVMLLLSNDGG